MKRAGIVVGMMTTVMAASPGCKVGPDYAAPEQPMPASWARSGTRGVDAMSQPVVEWWKTLNDPALDALVEQAVAGNLDLQVAAARVREARAQRGVVAADRYPNVNVNASYERSRASVNDGRFGDGGGAGFIQSRDQDSFEAGFDARWEVDIFGGVARSVEAADADIASAEESRRDVLVTLLAEVARNYVEVRGFQQRLDIARRNIDAQRATVDVAQAKFDAGLTSQLDVAQAKSQLAVTQSQVPVLMTGRDQAVHRIGVLLGREPGALIRDFETVREIPDAPAAVPVGLPADLLRRRPDVRQAERDLAGATARIGVATADLFPRMTLTGALGQRSEDLSRLFESGSTFWALSPSVSWPIFEGGRIKANIRVAEAREAQALAQYQQSVLGALEEVENALVAFGNERDRWQALQSAVQESRLAVDLANERYSQGVVDFLSVLDSQRRLYVVEDELVQSDRAVTVNLIAIYKALGGGWESPDIVADSRTGDTG